MIHNFLHYYKPYKSILYGVVIGSLVAALLDLVFPMLVRQILNEVLPQKNTDRLLHDTGILFILYLGNYGLLYLVNYYGHLMSAKIENDMRRDLFEHLQKLPFSYYDHTKIGQLMARITSDLFDVTEFAHHCPEEYFIAALKIVVSFVILANTNLLLTLIIFSLLPVMLLCTMYFNTRMRRAFKKSRNQIGELNAQVEDSLLGVRVVKSFANESIEEEKFSQGNGRFLDIKKEQYFYMAGFNSMTRIFDGLMYVAVLVAGALFMIAGRITAGDLMAYLLYVTALLTSIRRIVEFTEQFQRGMTGIERFIEVIDAPVDIKNAPAALPLGDVHGDIAFEHVSFHYSDDENCVLSDINLHVHPGDSVALVGPSGGGKSTLCNLIPRFYDVTAGRILIDGKDIRNLTLDSLRRNVGVVQQDVYLFAGSVYENIAYGRPGATREEVAEAARLAGAHDFIMEFPDGYDTYVGERGARLSGGQKQRISIARVFLKNPPILILDEATSALDNESERIVQQSLEQLARGRTTFTIAHRLTTIRGAQLILVLTEDGIAEQGTHAELMEKGGLYHRLYSMYTEM